MSQVMGASGERRVVWRVWDWMITMEKTPCSTGTFRHPLSQRTFCKRWRSKIKNIPKFWDVKFPISHDVINPCGILEGFSREMPENYKDVILVMMAVWMIPIDWGWFNEAWSSSLFFFLFERPINHRKIYSLGIDFFLCHVSNWLF